MTILKRIYSETGLFNEVVFHKGINIIRGIYTKKEEPVKTITDLNGIGKSTLIRLIDFAMLSENVVKKHFDVSKHSFLKNHTVTLEFESEGKIFFIKRGFDDSNQPKFGEEEHSLETYDAKELRKILENIFFDKDDRTSFYESGWFRYLTGFFIKDDLNHFDRKDTLEFVNKTYVGTAILQAMNLYLLGLPNKPVINFGELKKANDELKSQKRHILEKLKEDTGKDIEEIGSELSILNNKILSYEKSISNYTFLDSYQDVEKSLIEITGNISNLLSSLTLYERRLEEYRKSYEYKVEFDRNRVIKMYSELSQSVGEIVKKNLEEVVEFRKRLAENRKKFLREKELETIQEIDKIRREISTLEIKRSELYKILDEKKAFDSIKNTYSLLIEEKTKKEKLLAITSQIDKLDSDIYNKKIQISNVIKEISQEIQSVKERIDHITAIFMEIVKETIHLKDINDAVFDIRPKPEESSPLSITIDVPKSEALGKSRFRIISYDLAVFFNIIESNRKLPRFLIHDGVFHGIDKKTVMRILNLVYSKFLKNQDFQYIITANEDELLVPQDKEDLYGKYNFDLEKTICVTYKDSPEDMIFKQEY